MFPFHTASWVLPSCQRAGAGADLWFHLSPVICELLSVILWYCFIFAASLPQCRSTYHPDYSRWSEADVYSTPSTDHSCWSRRARRRGLVCQTRFYMYDREAVTSSEGSFKAKTRGLKEVFRKVVASRNSVWKRINQTQTFNSVVCHKFTSVVVSWWLTYRSGRRQT